MEQLLVAGCTYQWKYPRNSWGNTFSATNLSISQRNMIFHGNLTDALLVSVGGLVSCIRVDSKCASGFTVK